MIKKWLKITIFFFSVEELVLETIKYSKIMEIQPRDFKFEKRENCVSLTCNLKPFHVYFTA